MAGQGMPVTGSGWRRPDGAAEIRGALEHIPLVAMSPEQHRELNDLQQQHPECGIAVTAVTPGGAVEATVTTRGYPPVRHIFGYDAGDMLDRVAKAIEADPGG